MEKYACKVFICVLFILSASWGQKTRPRLKTVNGKIKLSLGTTAGCIDIVRLMIEAFTETYRDFKDFLIVEFLPWGRTKRDSNGNLICQFGEPDCWANNMHRCALELLKGNQDAQVRFMTCEFSLIRPGFNLRSYACAHAEGIDLNELNYCVTTSGKLLAYDVEEVAVPQMAAIDEVPSIVFNDNIDLDTHIEAWRRFKSLICEALTDDRSTGITFCL